MTHNADSCTIVTGHGDVVVVVAPPRPDEVQHGSTVGAQKKRRPGFSPLMPSANHLLVPVYQGIATTCSRLIQHSRILQVVKLILCILLLGIYRYLWVKLLRGARCAWYSLADVGRPLNEFESTLQAVLAIMKATEGEHFYRLLLRVRCTNLAAGHKSAWEIAGILHRDISLGNILIAEDTTRGGFLHDFDYSSMTEVIPGRQSDPVLFEVIKLDDHRKERTVSGYLFDSWCPFTDLVLTIGNFLLHGRSDPWQSHTDNP